MKDHTQEALEASRPDISAKEAVDFCLGRLYADRQHYIDDELAHNLTYEELIGALLAARDVIEEQP